MPKFLARLLPVGTVGVVGAMIVVSLMVVTSTFAAGTKSGFIVNPSTFVGAAGDCGPGYPAGHNIVTAAWQTHQGLPDAGNSNHALFLQKNGPTADCSSAGATIDGVAGITLNEIGWDVRDDGHCGAGAPRFNVVTSDNVTHFIGCSSPAPTTTTPLTDPQGKTWHRLRYDPAAAFPPIAPTATVQSISIVFDEGTDQGQGFVYLDNIDINGTLIGKPGNA
jgi:hypothetical protein